MSAIENSKVYSGMETNFRFFTLKVCEASQPAFAMRINSASWNRMPYSSKLVSSGTTRSGVKIMEAGLVSLPM